MINLFYNLKLIPLYSLDFNPNTFLRWGFQLLALGYLISHLMRCIDSCAMTEIVYDVLLVVITHILTWNWPSLAAAMQHVTDIWLEMISFPWSNDIKSAHQISEGHCLCSTDGDKLSCFPWQLYIDSTARWTTLQNCPVSWRSLAGGKAKPFSLVTFKMQGLLLHLSETKG